MGWGRVSRESVRARERETEKGRKYRPVSRRMQEKPSSDAKAERWTIACKVGNPGMRFPVFLALGCWPPVRHL